MVKRKQKIQRGKERDKNEAKLGITLSLRLFFAHAPLSERLEKATCIFERAYFRRGEGGITGSTAIQKWFRSYLEGILRLKIGILHLKMPRDSKSENAAPEEMWIRGGGVHFLAIPSVSFQGIQAQYKECTTTKTMIDDGTFKLSRFTLCNLIVWFYVYYMYMCMQYSDCHLRRKNNTVVCERIYNWSEVITLWSFLGCKHNISPWAYIWRNLSPEGFLWMRFGGFILREGLFSGGAGAPTIGILRYNHTKNTSAGER